MVRFTPEEIEELVSDFENTINEFNEHDDDESMEETLNLLAELIESSIRQFKFNDTSSGSQDGSEEGSRDGSEETSDVSSSSNDEWQDVEE